MAQVLVPKRPRALGKGALFAIVLLFCSIGVVHSQTTPNGGILNTVRTDYSNAIAPWAAAITPAATRLFWSLAIISMVWTFGMMALRKAEFQEVIMELLRFAITLGFFLWLLQNGPAFAIDIFNGLSQIGATAAHPVAGASPSGIMSQGFQLWSMAYAQTSFLSHMADSLVIMLTALVLIVVFALIAVNILLLTITAWLVAYAGIFVLGFGSSRWTSEMAIQYFRLALNVGLQMLTMTMIVAVGYSFMQNQIGAIPANGLQPSDMAVMLVSAIILLELCHKVPPVVGNLAGGSTGGIGQHGAAAAFAAGGAAVAAVTMAGSAAMVAARGATGGVSAVMSAYRAAGAASAGGGGAGGGATLAGGSAGNSGSGGAGSLSAAMGGGAAASGESRSASMAGAAGGDTGAAQANADDRAAAGNADDDAALTGASQSAPSTGARIEDGAQTPSAQGERDGRGNSDGVGQAAAAGSRLARTAGILVRGAGRTAIDHAMARVRERSIGGKIAATIDQQQAVKNRDTRAGLAASMRGRASSIRLSADAMDEIAEFAENQKIPEDNA